MRNGYIATSVALTIGSGLLGVFAWTYSQLQARDANISLTNERVAKLEEAVSTIKGDTSEIKGDIKTILRAVK